MAYAKFDTFLKEAGSKNAQSSEGHIFLVCQIKQIAGTFACKW